MQFHDRFARCFAFAMAISGPVFADGQAVGVVANRIEVGPLETAVGEQTGPLVLSVPGFEVDIFIISCRSGVPGGEGQIPEVGVRNGSRLPIDFFTGGMNRFPPPCQGEEACTFVEDNILHPGQSVQLGLAHASFTFQLGSGTGRNKRLATIVGGALSDNLGKCRIQAQAVVQQL